MIRSYGRSHEQLVHKNLEKEKNDKYENNSPEQTFSPQDFCPDNHAELHMAEKLVESKTGSNAFKFDTITPIKLNKSQDIQINAINMGK